MSPVEYDFVESAHRAHAQAGLDFGQAFDTWFTDGWVLKTPLCFIMAGHSPERHDAWFVWWAELHPNVAGDHRLMVREFLRLVPYRKPWIGWARMLHGRQTVKYYSTARLEAFTRE